MKDLEKLRVMIPHWIAHNREHADSFGEWAGKAGAAGAAIREAAAAMFAANVALERALEELGGALDRSALSHEHASQEEGGTHSRNPRLHSD